MKPRYSLVLLLAAATFLLIPGPAPAEEGRFGMPGNADPWLPAVVSATAGRWDLSRAIFFPAAETAPDGAPILEALVADEDGEARVRVLRNGFLWRLASPVHAADVPATAREAIATRLGPEPADFEHLWLMAYEVEEERPDGAKVERFLDPAGRELFGNVAWEDEEPPEVPETLSQLPPPARRVIEELLGGQVLDRLQQETEWSFPVHAARWLVAAGRCEVKVLDDGRILFLELSASDPVPEAVRQQAAGAAVEPLLLEAYRAVPANGDSPEVVVLSSGRVL